MRYITLLLGIISIAIVTVINFYPDETREFIDKFIYKKAYIIAKDNDY